MRKDYVEIAKNICREAHTGQKDKLGKDYYLHPFAVADMIESANIVDENILVTAYLHDVIEDTDWTIHDLEEAGFPSEVIEAVDILTHKDGDSYQEYLDKIIVNDIALTVKKYDLLHNFSPERSAGLNNYRRRKYVGALNYLKMQGDAITP